MHDVDSDQREALRPLHGGPGEVTRPPTCRRVPFPTTNKLEQGKMKHLRRTLIVLVWSVILRAGLPAQDAGTAADAEKPPEYGWKHSLVAGLNLTQVSFTNWAQGGENAIAYALSLDGKSALQNPKTLWENQYRFAFGQARLGRQGLKKTDDVIDMASVFTYLLGETVNPYASATFKSQFATGFKYDDNNVGTPVAKFMDPGYFTQAVGIRYQPMPEIRTRLGVALREVVTDKYTVYADDPKTFPEIEKTGVKGGLESVTDVEWKVDENILFVSQLSVFDPFSDAGDPVVLNTTTITGKVNSYLSASLGFQMIYDKAVSPRAQYKENISLGFSYTLF